MQDKIIISGMGSISALGSDANEIWNHYQSETTRITNCCFNNTDTPVGKLYPKEEALIKKLRQENSNNIRYLHEYAFEDNCHKCMFPSWWKT